MFLGMLTGYWKNGCKRQKAPVIHYMEVLTWTWTMSSGKAQNPGNKSNDHSELKGEWVFPSLQERGKNHTQVFSIYVLCRSNHALTYLVSLQYLWKTRILKQNNFQFTPLLSSLLELKVLLWRLFASKSEQSDFCEMGPLLYFCPSSHLLPSVELLFPDEKKSWQPFHSEQ